MNDPKFAEYRQLLQKVSEKFGEIAARNADRMACGRGCHQCCIPDLTVFGVERDFLRALIESTPGLEQKLRELKEKDPFNGTRCEFLDGNGSCSVYEARPVICRSHGAPIFSKDEQDVILDVCPLNFTDVESLDKIPGQDFINLEIVNSLLAVINRRFEGTDDGYRHLLSIDSILGPR